MAYRITNTGKGPRGVWADGSLVWLQPGQTKTIEPDNPDVVARNRDLSAEPVGEVPEAPADLAAAIKKPHALDHDGDGKKGGSRKGAASTRTRGKRKGARKATR